MDIASLIYIPLFNNLQSPLFSTPFNPFLPSNKHPNKHPNKHSNRYFNNNINYLNNKLNSNTIKAF